MGSNPSARTNAILYCCPCIDGNVSIRPLAQMEERLPYKQDAGGSNPSGPTNFSP